MCQICQGSLGNAGDQPAGHKVLQHRAVAAQGEELFFAPVTNAWLTVLMTQIPFKSYEM